MGEIYLLSNGTKGFFERTSIKSKPNLCDLAITTIRRVNPEATPRLKEIMLFRNWRNPHSSTVIQSYGFVDISYGKKETEFFKIENWPDYKSKVDENGLPFYPDLALKNYIERMEKLKHPLGSSYDALIITKSGERKLKRTINRKIKDLGCTIFPGRN
jgi:hypothetical protein